LEFPKKTIIKNFLYLVITKGIDFIIPLILLPFLVGRLGISSFGVLSFALAIGVYFSSFMQYGYNISAVRSIARCREDKFLLSTVFSELWVSSALICSAVSICYLFLFTFDLVNSEFNLYASVLFFILMQSIFPAWLFQGLEKMHYIAISNGLCKLVYLIAVLMLIENSTDTYLVPLLLGASWALALLLAFYIIRKQQLVSFIFPSVRGVVQTYKQGWSAFVTQLAPTLYSNSMVFILGVFHGSIIVGIYSAAIRVIEIVNAFAFLLVNAAIPHLSRDIKFHHKFKNIVVLVGIFAGFAVCLGANYFTSLLFSENLAQITTIVQLGALMIPFVFMRLAYGPAYLMLIGFDRQYQHIVFGTSMAGFCFAWLVVPEWKAEAAVIVMVLSSMVMALLTVYVARLDKVIEDH